MSHFSDAGINLEEVKQIKIDTTAAESGTIYFDNIYFFANTGVPGTAYMAPPAAAGPSDAPVAPTVAASSVTSIFSDAYTDISGVTLNPSWRQAGVGTSTVFASNNVFELSNLNYQGVDFSANKQDVSDLSTLHFDYWTPSSAAKVVSQFQFFLISDDGTKAEFAYTVNPTVGDAWQSIDVPLSHFSNNGVSLADIVQLKIDAQSGNTGGTLYLDNIYFYGGSGGSGSTTPTATGYASAYQLFASQYEATGNNAAPWVRSKENGNIYTGEGGNFSYGGWGLVLTMIANNAKAMECSGKTPVQTKQ